ncbi:hypothetical protein HYC85_004439 [Camellia sinensis]|uniref:protein-serine/threonine phosphatase n=1 Tax=Camellia sinensis TaxID=4442 RepID=A0A7J7HYM8_CAMSI|nr:hypothetical protein HYC85_004439 [Camellia sinensis]
MVQASNIEVQICIDNPNSFDWTKCQLQMGVYLSTPKTEKVSEDCETDRLRYGLSSMQGWRSSMEDAHAAHLDLDTSTSFFGVYDGHGGKAVAKFCAKYLHQQVLKHEAYLAGDLGTSLQKAFLRMDEMMCGQRGWRELTILGDKIEQTSDMVEGLIESPKSGEANGHVDDWLSEEGPHSDFHGPHYGSTACVAIIRNNQLLVANAGDSRCVISRKGQAYNLTRDHKPNLEAENERILKAGGSVRFGRVNGNLNLTRAIGDMELKQNKSLPAENQILTANPDVNTVELCDDDEFIVLACDGIWDCMSSQEVVDFVREQLKTETKLSVLCERVFDRCIAPLAGGKGCDNMTMILVQFKKPFGDSVSTKEQPFLWYPDPHSDPDSDSDSDTDEIPTEPEVKE